MQETEEAQIREFLDQLWNIFPLFDESIQKLVIATFHCGMAKYAEATKIKDILIFIDDLKNNRESKHERIKQFLMTYAEKEEEEQRKRDVAAKIKKDEGAYTLEQ